MASLTQGVGGETIRANLLLTLGAGCQAIRTATVITASATTDAGVATGLFTVGTPGPATFANRCLAIAAIVSFCGDELTASMALDRPPLVQRDIRAVAVVGVQDTIYDVEEVG